MKNNILLGVNIDHVATLRQARLTNYPDPIEAVFAVENGGADGITVHLREDRRHIQERDIELIQQVMMTKLNLELAITDEMIKYAEKIKPLNCCFVPEKRNELTTEGGLDVIAQEKKIMEAVTHLQNQQIEVSLFIDPDLKQIAAAARTGAKAIEIHTGAYAEAKNIDKRHQELIRIQKAAQAAQQAKLIVNAGHGLHYQNVQAIAMIPELNELNIGHAIIAKAIFIGLTAAVCEMKYLLQIARNT